MWKADPTHEKTLRELFLEFNRNKKYRILDAGSGRTSLQFLTKGFNKSKVFAIIYPGDKRKSESINESIHTKNFILQEIDIHKYPKGSKFDIVLAHLLLGEATKFSKQPFEKMLNSLFRINTDYLIIVDFLADPEVDYRLLLKFIAERSYVQKIVYEGKFIGFVLKKKKSR